MFIKLHYHSMGGKQELVVNSDDISRYIKGRTPDQTTVWIRSDPTEYFNVDESVEEINRMLGVE